MQTWWSDSPTKLLVREVLQTIEQIKNNFRVKKPRLVFARQPSKTIINHLINFTPIYRTFIIAMCVGIPRFVEKLVNAYIPPVQKSWYRDPNFEHGCDEINI